MLKALPEPTINDKLLVADVSVASVEANV